LGEKVVAPQQLLVVSLLAIRVPGTNVALAKSFCWELLMTPSLLVDNVSYDVATLIGCCFMVSIDRNDLILFP
jgi:hypothetical protein